MSLCQPVIWSMAAMLRDSVVVVVVRTRPRAILLAMITMMLMGLRLEALRAARAPLLAFYHECRFPIGYAAHCLLCDRW